MLSNEKEKIFQSLVDNEKPKRAAFLDELDEEIDQQWEHASALIIFKVLDLMKSGQKPMKQNELADKIGVSPQYINKLLKGRQNLTLETMIKIAQALGIELYEFFNTKLQEEEESQLDVCTTSEFNVEALFADIIREGAGLFHSSAVETIIYEEEFSY